MRKKQPKASKEQTVFIRANDAATLKLIEEVKKHTGIGVATKAFVYASESYIRQKTTIANLEKELSATKLQLREANELLQRLATSHNVLTAYAKKFLTGKHPQGELY
jgi:hypothetical protein